MPPELIVHGPRWARVTTDAAAVAGVLSFVAAFWWDAVAVALFALVLLGLTLPRVAGLPAPLQATSGVTLVVAAWAATLDWYAVVPPLDLLAHVLANGLLAATAVIISTRAGIIPPAPTRPGMVLVTTAVGALLGVLWEVGEWLGHTWLDDAINVGYDDTMGDLLAGTVGSLLAGSALAASEGDGDV